MAIDFFEEECLTKTKVSKFGIIDIPPSTLNYENSQDWQLTIINAFEKEISHIAIDHCLEIPDTEGKRCESLITYDDVIIFIEIKDRSSGKWVAVAREQLLNTIKLFQRDSEITKFKRRYAQIANKQKPHFRAVNHSLLEEFSNETGFVLRVGNTIEVE